jgi:hypothetical protein
MGDGKSLEEVTPGYGEKQKLIQPPHQEVFPICRLHVKLVRKGLPYAIQVRQNIEEGIGGVGKEVLRGSAKNPNAQVGCMVKSLVSFQTPLRRKIHFAQRLGYIIILPGLRSKEFLESLLLLKSVPNCVKVEIACGLQSQD